MRCPAHTAAVACGASAACASMAWWIQAALGGVDGPKPHCSTKARCRTGRGASMGGEKSGFSVGENIMDTPSSVDCRKMAGRYEGGLRYEPAITGAQALQKLLTDTRKVSFHREWNNLQGAASTCTQPVRLDSPCMNSTNSYVNSSPG